MKKAYMVHHLGLGDHILCNAIYRNFAKQYDVCAIPVKQRNAQSLSDMLADLKNVHILELKDQSADSLMLQQEAQYRTLGFDIIKLGYFGENFLKDAHMRYDANYYLQAGLDFDKRWSEFHYPRDLEVEYELFKKVCGGAKEGEYIFFHEDPSRGFVINRNLIPEDYKLITPGTKKQHTLGCDDDGRFFQYGYILENAASIHCIESAFVALADSLSLPSSIQKYAHRYARPEAPSDRRFEFSYKSDWNILT
jgi:hypothetical protein